MATRAAALAMGVALLLTGCAGGMSHDRGAMTDDSTSHDDRSMNHDETSSFGAPGDPADATTTVEVKTMDALVFDPSSIELDTGKTVTFVVINSGKLPHELVLGDASYQSSHADHMGSSEHGSNAVSVAPGATARITWMFTEAGSFEFACHVEGHYAGGMRGTIHVT